jgi:hypothetical protein
VLLLLGRCPQYLEAASGDEHSARESYLYYKQLHATDTTVATNPINLRSASAKARELTWKRRARGEHSARESYLITVVVLPFKILQLQILLVQPSRIFADALLQSSNRLLCLKNLIIPQSCLALCIMNLLLKLGCYLTRCW